MVTQWKFPFVLDYCVPELNLLDKDKTMYHGHTMGYVRERDC